MLNTRTKIRTDLNPLNEFGLEYKSSSFAPHLALPRVTRASLVVKPLLFAAATSGTGDDGPSRAAACVLEACQKMRTLQQRSMLHAAYRTNLTRLKRCRNGETSAIQSEI